jgi:hypothetical protein
MLAALYGCGDNTAPVVLRIPYSTPELLSYRTTQGWMSPVRTSDGFQLMVASDYEVVMVCTTATGRPDIEILMANAADGDQQLAPTLPDSVDYGGTCWNSHGTGTLANVRGDVYQPGSVSIAGVSTTSFDSQWSYNLLTTTGTRDLVMSSELVTPPKSIVRRDVEVMASIQNQMPPLDLYSSEAVPLLARTANSNADPSSESINSIVELFTKNGTQATISDNAGNTFYVLPQPAPDDLERLDLSAAGGGIERTASVPLTGADSVTVALLPALTGAYSDVLDGIRVAWNGMERLQDTNIELTVIAPDSIVHGVQTAMRANETSTFDLLITSDVPGWSAAWQPSWIGDAISTQRTFGVTRTSDQGSYRTVTTTRPGH